MKKLALSLAALIGLAIVTSAASEARPSRADQTNASRQQATPHHTQRVTKKRQAKRAHHARRHTRSNRSYRSSRHQGRGRAVVHVANSGGVGPRPRRWCGWWMRTQLGGGPAFNLAWNWRHYGSPTTPRVGAVVVWRHHVGIITGQASNGRWLVKSGNDGGAVRERARSVSGAVFRI